MSTMNKIAYIVMPNNRAGYVPHLRRYLAQVGFSRLILDSNVSGNMDTLIRRARVRQADAVVIAHPQQVIVLGKEYNDPKPSMGNWAGSFIQDYGIPMLVLNDLRTVHTQDYGEHALQCYLSKLRTRCIPSTPDVIVPSTAEEYEAALRDIEDAVLLAVDIESTHHIIMTMCGYCGYRQDGSIFSYVFVLGDTEETKLRALRAIQRANNSPAPKVLHNGLFDSAYFTRYNVPLRNYLFDTEYMYYCMYVDSPKSLAFVSGLYSPVMRYWKHEADLHMVKYCGLDCFNTLLTCRVLLDVLPSYARRNYAMLHPMFPVVTYMSMSGVNVDDTAREVLAHKAKVELDKLQETFKVMCGGYEFNVNSPKQMKTLLYDILGAPKHKVHGTIGGTDSYTLAHLSEISPLLARYCALIQEIRELNKALSTYYKAPLFNGRLLYSYRIDGTATGRLSCTKSNFGWSDKTSYGAQIQNIPRYLKPVIIPSEGYIMMEVDKSQSEARCTAYIAGDRKLIEAIEGEEDFYCKCAKLFFGVDDETALKLRQLVKKIIHGSNYMMGVQTFIESVAKDMGTVVLYEAMALLSWPKDATLHDFVGHILQLYRKTYDKLPRWYEETQATLVTSGHFTSPKGWTRVFRGDTSRYSALQGAVAHQPQHLSVELVNEALLKAYHKLVIPSNGQFRLLAQVHDSILAEAKEERAGYYFKELKDCLDSVEAQMPNIPEKPLRIPTDGHVGSNWAECH